MIPQVLFLLESGRSFPVEIHRVFGLDQQTFIGVLFVLINLSILAFVLARFLYNPVRKFLADRTERIHSQLKQAEDEKSAAGELRTQYEAKLKNIDIERDQILDAARKQATEKTKQMMDEARTEADVIRERAERNIAMEQERVKDEMRRSIIDISSAMAQKFVERAMDSETQDKLFAEVVAELEEADFTS